MVYVNVQDFKNGMVAGFKLNATYDDVIDFLAMNFDLEKVLFTTEIIADYGSQKSML